MYSNVVVTAAIYPLLTFLLAHRVVSNPGELAQHNAHQRSVLAVHQREPAQGDIEANNDDAPGAPPESSATSTDIGLATLFDAIISPSDTTLIEITDRGRGMGKRQDAGPAPGFTVTITTATTQVATLTSSVPSTTIVVNTQDVTYTTSNFATTTQVSTVPGRTTTSTTVTQVTSTSVTTAQPSTVQTTASQTTTAISTHLSTVTRTLQDTTTQIGTTFITVTTTVTAPTSTATGPAITTTLAPLTVLVGPVVYPSTGPCAPVFRHGPVMYCQGNA